MAVDSYSLARNEPCTHNSQCSTARCNQNGFCETASHTGRQCNPKLDPDQCSTGNKCDANAWRCMPLAHNIRPDNCTKAYDCAHGDYCPSVGKGVKCMKAKPLGGQCNSNHNTFALGRECEDGSWCYEGICRKRWSTKHPCAGNELSIAVGKHTAPVCLPNPQVDKPAARELPKPVEEEPEEEVVVQSTATNGKGTNPHPVPLQPSAPLLPSTTGNHSWLTKVGLPEMTTKQLAMLGGSIALTTVILVVVILALRKCCRKPKKDDDERKAESAYSPMVPSLLPPTYSSSQPAGVQSAGGASYMTTPIAGEKPTRTGEKQANFI